MCGQVNPHLEVLFCLCAAVCCLWPLLLRLAGREAALSHSLLSFPLNRWTLVFSPLSFMTELSFFQYVSLNGRSPVVLVCHFVLDYTWYLLMGGRKEGGDVPVHGFPCVSPFFCSFWPRSPSLFGLELCRLTFSFPIPSSPALIFFSKETFYANLKTFVWRHHILWFEPICVNLLLWRCYTEYRKNN